jgi:hypothetical protein
MEMIEYNNCADMLTTIRRCVEMMTKARRQFGEQVKTELPPFLTAEEIKEKVPAE